jgi:hypothetical protein
MEQEACSSAFFVVLTSPLVVKGTRLLGMCHTSQVLFRMQVGSFGLTLARHAPRAWQGGLEHLVEGGVTPFQLVLYPMDIVLDH